MASKLAKELDLGLSDEDVASQANWLAQASLSIAIVKKQLAANVTVTPDTRQKYVAYLKQLLDDDESNV